MNSVGDADVLTVKKAIEIAKNHRTVVSDDRHSCLTDVSLVLHNEGYCVCYNQISQQEESRTFR